MKKPSEFPPLCCDFNACGLSGRSDDTCYYNLDRNCITGFKAGDQVFLYDDDIVDGAPRIVGIEAELIDDRGRLIARPLLQDFYYGPRFW